MLGNHSFQFSVCFSKQTCRKQIRQHLSVLPYQQGWPSVFVWRREHGLLERADNHGLLVHCFHLSCWGALVFTNHQLEMKHLVRN